MSGFGKQNTAATMQRAQFGRKASGGHGQASGAPSAYIPAGGPFDLETDFSEDFATWTRVVSFLIDAVFAFLLFALWFLSQKAEFMAMPKEQGVPTLLVMFYSTRCAYYTALEGCFGATIGKLICGIVVTDVHGRPAGFGRILLRNTVGRMITALAPCFSGYALAFFLPKKQTIHDFISGTTVRKVG